jgi:hypothetical protein
MLQPAAVAGTNADVLGEAPKESSVGGCTPSDIGFAVFQTYFVISPPPLTVNVDELGMVTQS